MEAATLSEARVYVGTYGKYNNGSLFGAWLDLSDYSDKEDFYEACRELHKDEEDAEYMFQDWENVPENLIGESWISENFFTLRDAVEKLGDTEQEAFFVWCNYKSHDLSEEDADDLVRDFQDEYQGQYDDTFRTNIRDNMTMKKISPTKSWKNVTTCRSSQKPISTTNSLPVICSCATTGLMTGLYSGRLKRPFGRG